MGIRFYRPEVVLKRFVVLLALAGGLCADSLGPVIVSISEKTGFSTVIVRVDELASTTAVEFWVNGESVKFSKDKLIQMLEEKR